MKLLISTSLKVVNIAFVFYASFSLYAILILILFIGTLVSVLVPVIPVGAFVPFYYCVGAYLGGADGASYFCFSSFGAALLPSPLSSACIIN